MCRIFSQFGFPVVAISNQSRFLFRKNKKYSFEVWNSYLTADDGPFEVVDDKLLLRERVLQIGNPRFRSFQIRGFIQKRRLHSCSGNNTKSPHFSFKYFCVFKVFSREKSFSFLDCILNPETLWPFERLYEKAWELREFLGRQKVAKWRFRFRF